MKVLFLIRRCSMHDGATLAMVRYIRNNASLGACCIGCRFDVDPPEGIPTVRLDSRADMRRLLKEGRFDVIHYFKTSGYDLFDWAVAARRKLRLRTPIVTTVCQRPSYPTLLLSPSELRHSDRLVLIDNTSLADPLLQFVPRDRKQRIYFGASDADAELTGHLAAAYTPKPGRILIGRGSTPGKLPADYCDITDAITATGKQVVIAGIPEGHPAARMADHRPYVTIAPPRPYREWLELCATFDIFLYYLPVDGHSSIDGTLGQAMMLEKPVVYYGPAAPAERLQHGVNALVALHPGELAGYCDRLADDPALRRRLGQAARRTTLAQFSIHTTVEAYNDLYRRLLDPATAKPEPVTVPHAYRLHFMRNSGKEWLRSRMGGTIVERLHHRLKPLPLRT